jgi:hypothetical protein
MSVQGEMKAAERSAAGHPKVVEASGVEEAAGATRPSAYEIR